MNFDKVVFILVIIIECLFLGILFFAFGTILEYIFGDLIGTIILVILCTIFLVLSWRYFKNHAYDGFIPPDDKH